MNTLAVLSARPPVKPATDATAGSFCTIACNCASFFSIALNEMLWSAMICPIRMPVSCSGKNVAGQQADQEHVEHEQADQQQDDRERMVEHGRRASASTHS